MKLASNDTVRFATMNLTGDAIVVVCEPHLRRMVGAPKEDPLALSICELIDGAFYRIHHLTGSQMLVAQQLFNHPRRSLQLGQQLHSQPDRQRVWACSFGPCRSGWEPALI